MLVAAGLVASPFTTAAAAGAPALSLLVQCPWQWLGVGAGAATRWQPLLPAQQVAQGGSQLAPGCAAAATVPRRLQVALAVAAPPLLALAALALPQARVQLQAGAAGAAGARVGARP
jgi:hypothetical protein